MSDYGKIRERMHDKIPRNTGTLVDVETARCVLDIVAAELVSVPRYLNTPEEPIDYASDAVDRLCPSCGAEPGQQCSDSDGTEHAMFVHSERIGSTCNETVTRGLFEEAVALLRRARVHVAPSSLADEIRQFVRDVDEFPCCCDPCVAERTNAAAKTPESP